MTEHGRIAESPAVRLCRAVALTVLCLASLPAAAAGPMPPCAGTPMPAAPRAESEPPNLAVWSSETLGAWTAPACLGWTRPRFATTGALAGIFRFAGSEADLAARVGAVSAMRGLRYWSVTDGAWRTLVTDAAALDGPDPVLRRGDFAAAELLPGAERYFVESDSRSSGSVVYRLKVLERGPDRLAVTLANVTPVRLLFLTLYDREDLESTYFFRRVGPALWELYALSGAGAKPSWLTGGHQASFVNRMVALYRYFSGAPSDVGPRPQGIGSG